MDFFAAQDLRRKRTHWLVGLFALSILTILGLVYLAVTLFLHFRVANLQFLDPSSWAWWDTGRFCWTTLGTLTVIGVGIYDKHRKLSLGGGALVTRLGGRQVPIGPKPDDELRLWNVVQEMALASGTPMPDVFVLEGAHGVNALAAGNSVYDSAIAVSQGALKILNRDELQALVGHEFSHILNGDMKLNMNLLGWLHGIQAIGLTGLFLIRASSFARIQRLSLGPMILGSACVALGSIGVFWGRLIKRAISRQREYMADASAVQFTRNPIGITGVLKKIGGYRWGSRINHPNVEEMSHMYFSSAFRQLKGSWLSTHPPLLDRIKHIEPSFDGTYPEIAKNEALPGVPTQLSPTFSVLESSADFLTHITPEHMAFASAFLSDISTDLKSQVQESTWAQALVCALLLDKDAGMREKQANLIKANAGDDFWQKVEQVESPVAACAENGRLPLLTLASPSLRSLEKEKKKTFYKLLKAMVDADEKISLFEFILGRTLKNHVFGQSPQSRNPVVQYLVLRPLLPSCAKLFSVLANIGDPDNPKRAQSAFDRGAQSLSRFPLRFHAPGDVSFREISRVLDRLLRASPGLKRRILKACSVIAFFDETVTIQEAELLRVIADSLGTPLPPILKTGPDSSA